MDRAIAVLGASHTLPGDPHFVEAARCGELLANGGFAVATGGYAGTMEAVSQGARDADGQVVGVNAPEVVPGRVGASGYVGHERRASSLIERIGLLVETTDGAIAL